LNPLQVSRTLEATVLDSLAILNRAGVFVYKDESESVFYMRLEAIGSGIDGDGKVELLVHGVNTPGPSITKQLTSLLERRVLLIAVDMLSNVLMKNPHFNWKFPDFKFLRSFEEDWSSLEESKATTVEAQDCFYEFPAEADDPCMVLLMFRQNICGSSFFHRLNDVGEGSLSLPITLSKRLEDGLTRWRPSTRLGEILSRRRSTTQAARTLDQTKTSGLSRTPPGGAPLLPPHQKRSWT